MGLSDVRFDGGTRISGMTATSPCALEYNAIYPLFARMYVLVVHGDAFVAEG